MEQNRQTIEKSKKQHGGRVASRESFEESLVHAGSSKIAIVVWYSVV